MKEITLACEAFQKLLEEQLERIRNMNGEKTDFSTKKQVTIGVIDGDGIGPIITAQATRVLEKLLAEEIAAGSIVIKQIEGLTIENRMACGKAIPDVEQAMQEGFSTAGQTARELGFGAGMGLPNMKRYSDEMTIDTEVGKGTTVTVKINIA